MATYREVKCPYCDHVFMWMKDGGEWGIGRVYRYINEKREFIGKETACPACSERIVVLEGIFEGTTREDLGPNIRCIGEIPL